MFIFHDSSDILISIKNSFGKTSQSCFLWILLVNKTLFIIFAAKGLLFVFFIADRLAFLRDCFANI
ncbi:hypothetical protein DW107_01000 [Tannerella sp. AM09-19]|nr:hypothetical protein DW107_01000 [Tannerella sp. AM09-19]